MKNNFYLFGSEYSIIVDILIDVENIPSVKESHDLIKLYNEYFSKFYDKKINCNLVTIKNGEIIKSFKGSQDEVNNSLFYTYKNHKQIFPNPILKIVKRDFNEKILRIARVLLTFYSRTDMRIEIKRALRGNLIEKLNVLKKFDFTIMNEFPNKSDKKEDIFKTIAFQLGQFFCLKDDLERHSYTKDDLMCCYPELFVFLNRGTTTHDNFVILNKYLIGCIKYTEDNIENLRLFEKKNT
jgi:hypothetical protein